MCREVDISQLESCRSCVRRKTVFLRVDIVVLCSGMEHLLAASHALRRSGVCALIFINETGRAEQHRDVADMRFKFN